MASLAVSASASASGEEVTHLAQREAAEIDEQLMGPLGFSVDQLMVRYSSLPPPASTRLL
jgi:NAD(P)H-hydrate epimerase